MSIASNQNEEVRVFMPRNELKSKVGEGGVDINNIRKAEKRMADTKDIFPALAKGEMTQLKRAIENVRKGHDMEQAQKDIQMAAFELKSNGGMFNFLLVSDAGKSLFDFCEAIDTIDEQAMRVIDLHYRLLAMLVKEEDNTKKLELRMEMRTLLEMLNSKILKRIQP